MSRFTDLTQNRRSLIFVQSMEAHRKVTQTLRANNVSYFSTYLVGSTKAMARFHEFLGRQGALVVMLPDLTDRGFIRADQIIWIAGDKYPHEPDPENASRNACYQNAMFRIRGTEAPRIVLRECEI